MAQSVQETTLGSRPWSSSWWVQRLNPAGIGITGDPVQNLQSHTWQTGTEAAQSHAGHLLVYCLGPSDAGSLWHQKVGGPPLSEIDPRYDEYLAAYGNVAIAQTIKDLSGTWATDKLYAEGICARGNAVFPNLPDQEDKPPVTDLNMAKGLIPLPAMAQDIINVAARDQSIACRGYDNLGPRPSTPKFLVLHRSINGVGQSNSGYFHETCCPALTDLEVIAASGQGRRFVALPGNVSGWANGVVSNPYGDALAWLNLHGGDLATVNRDGESCEITGNYGDPVSAAAWQWLAQWIASRAHDYGIRYDTFPLIPAEANRSYVTWHQEWTIGTGKVCPGTVVMNGTNDLLAKAKAIMQAAQTATKPDPVPTYADPIVPDWLTADLKAGVPSDHDQDGLTYYGAARTYKAIKEANRLQKADIKSPKVGPRIKVGEQFRAAYIVRDAAGHNYVLTPYGTHVDAKALTPRVTVKAA